MKKAGHLHLDEPFDSLFTQGMVIHETFRNAAGEWILPAEARQVDGKWVHAGTGEPLTVGGIEKMSKSKKNVVDPETIIEAYGADTARWFMLSDTPPERDIEWTSGGAEGAWRFTQRIWRLVNEAATRSPGAMDLALQKTMHKTIAAVTDDLNGLRFNRAIARLYELANAIGSALQGTNTPVREAAEALVLMFAPMMPHLAEECWAVLDKQGLVVSQAWPRFDEALVVDDEVTLAIQVNGKRRDEIRVAKGLGQEQLEPMVLGREAVLRALDGKAVRKFIVVPDRIVNIVC
jgi:leucyl-tRNA synthetase